MDEERCFVVVLDDQEVAAGGVEDTLKAHQLAASGLVWVHSAHPMKHVLCVRTSYAVLKDTSFKPLLAGAC